MIDLEALKIALSRENNSIETYQKMLVDHPGLKELLSFLLTEEEKHKVLIEKKIRELTLY
ncbi:MAG: rubrerythrin family protein [Candidatus Omnitrophica bacterium]|nr:rubrerythrin family protein [Candidatus Omnitrophota bacterium]